MDGVQSLREAAESRALTTQEIVALFLEEKEAWLKSHPSLTDADFYAEKAKVKK